MAKSGGRQPGAAGRQAGREGGREERTAFAEWMDAVSEFGQPGTTGGWTRGQRSGPNARRAPGTLDAHFFFRASEPAEFCVSRSDLPGSLTRSVSARFHAQKAVRRLRQRQIVDSDDRGGVDSRGTKSARRRARRAQTGWGRTRLQDERSSVEEDHGAGGRATSECCPKKGQAKIELKSREGALP